MGELDGKVAVITGAGSGMARASTAAFVREGAKVLAADVSGRQEDTAKDLGDAVVPFHVDVTAEADVEAMFAAAVEAFGRVDAVLNVAGKGGAHVSMTSGFVAAPGTRLCPIVFPGPTDDPGGTSAGLQEVIVRGYLVSRPR